jgi:hypothetical protein
MNELSLVEKILEFIKLQREDDYWDFKENHHSNKAELLHDIICLANNRTLNDGYLIFGVRDVTFEVVGLSENGGAIRRNQQNIIDFLSEKKFARGIRPKVRMNTIIIDGLEVDVLIVENTLDTPYYLVEDYSYKGKIVKANHIYSRIADSNTSIKKSADDNIVECLWKKRFGLHLKPFEKLRFHLRDKHDWIYKESGYYNKTNPEFTMILKDEDAYERNLPPFYAFVMTNTHHQYQTLEIKYFGTILYSCKVVLLDGVRLISTCPKFGSIETYKEKRRITYSFRYFLKDDILFDLSQFFISELLSESFFAAKRLNSVVLTFGDDFEQKSFTDYVLANIDLLDNLIANEDEPLTMCSDIENESFRESVVENLKIGAALKKIQKNFDGVATKMYR